MPRRRSAEIREVQPDPMYGSTLAEKFVNSLMWDGKKTVAQRVFYAAMNKVAERSGEDALKMFKKAVENAAKLLADLGHTVEEAAPAIDREKLVRAYLTQVGIGVASEIQDMARWSGRKPSSSHFEPATWFLRQVGMTMTGLDLQHARDAAQEAGRATAAFHAKYDLFLGSTLAYPPVRIGELALKPAELAGLAALRAFPIPAAIRAVLAQLAANSLERTPNTQLFNQTGQPAISLPLHWTPEGLPVGVQLAAAMGGEDLLLRVSSQIEAAAPWIGRKPGG